MHIVALTQWIQVKWTVLNYVMSHTMEKMYLVYLIKKEQFNILANKRVTLLDSQTKRLILSHDCTANMNLQAAAS